MQRLRALALFKKAGVSFWLEEFARILKPEGLLIATIEGRTAIPVVARELNVPAESITEALDADGVRFKNYVWLNELQARGPFLLLSVVFLTAFLTNMARRQ